jgi:hypothetical protein
VNPDDPVTFGNLESRIPEIYDVPDRFLRRFPRPRIIKSHETFDPRYKKVLYIVRDPRDVVLSYYEFQLKRRVISDDLTFETFLPRFMKSEFEPQTGNWADHVLSWVALRQGRSEFLLLRYEDMKERTEQEAAKIATFLNLDADPERVARAIQLSSVERMRALEKEQSRQWKETKGTRQDKPFVGRAVTGGWRSALPEECVAEIEAAWGNVMRLVDYPLVTRPDPGIGETLTRPAPAGEPATTGVPSRR